MMLTSPCIPCPGDARRICLIARRTWVKAHGPVPRGFVVYRACQNIACVALPHLRAGTKAEANRFSVCTVLVDGDIDEIRKAAAVRGPKTAKALAHRLGVTPETIRSIWRGETWRRTKPGFRKVAPPRHPRREK